VHLVPRETLEVRLGLPPRVVTAALGRMISSPEPPAFFRPRDTLAGHEGGEGGLRLWIIPSFGSMALFEARAEVAPDAGGGARVSLRLGPRPGATSFFWSLGGLVVAAGAVMLAFGHLAGAVTMVLPLLGWWGRFLAESIRIAQAVRRLEGGRRRALLPG
jgi:hypothetical protein